MKKILIMIISIIILSIIVYMYLNNRKVEDNKLDDNSIIIFKQENDNKIETVPQSPTQEQLMSGEIDMDEYYKNLENQSINNVTLEVKEETITRTGATFVLTDRNKVFCNYGSEYRIEVKKNGKWEMQKTITEGVTWNSGYSRPGAEISEVKKDWSKIYGKLKNGEYRIGLYVFTNTGNNGYVYAEFTIK